MRFAARTAPITLIAVLTAVLTAGCSSIRIGSSWSEPGRPNKAYSDLLVFGVAPKPKVQKAYEASFVSELKAKGVRARAGSALLPRGNLGDPAALRQAVAASGADGVIVTYLVGEKAKIVVIPQQAYRDPEYYGRLSPYYGQVRATVTAPGYYARYPVLQLETNLYDAHTESLVWSGRSETMDPGSERATISQLIGTVVSALIEGG